MGASATPVVIMTVFWFIVAFIVPLPFLFGNKPNKGVVTTVCLISGISLWLFWALAYVHQMNPLIGPSLHNTTLLAIMDIWDGTYVPSNSTMENATMFTDASEIMSTTEFTSATTMGIQDLITHISTSEYLSTTNIPTTNIPTTDIPTTDIPITTT